MNNSPIFFIKQEDKGDDGASLFNLGFDIKIKVENASPDGVDEMDWCVNPDLFDSYINEYDELLECSKQECVLCHEKFDDLYALYQHNISHMTIPLSSCLYHFYQCDACNVYFQTEDKLKAHRVVCNNHKAKKEYQCYECGKIMSYKSWHSHKLTVHRTDKAVCMICSKKFKCHQYLRKHMKYVHEGERPCWKINSDVKCDLCPTVLRNKHALKTHMNNCHSESEFTCGVCQAVFKSKPYLRTHIARVHDGDGKKYKCVCGKNYGSSRRLRRHKQRSGCES